MRTAAIWAGGVLTGVIVATAAQAVLADGDKPGEPPAVVAAAPPMAIYACVNNLNGLVTIVSADKKCPNNASALHWSTEPPAPPPRASGVLRLGTVPAHVAAGAVGQTEITCHRGEVATGFVSWPAGRMQLLEAQPMAEAGRELATDGYQGGAMATSVGEGMTVIGYRFRGKNALRGPYDGGFGGVLCQVP